MSTYMKIDGIKGSATANGYDGWIEINTVDFNFSRASTMEVGRTNFRQPGKLMFKPVVITKVVDASSVGLIHNVYAGASIKRIIIDCCHTDDQLEPHIRYELSDVMITNYASTIDLGIPEETIELIFEVVQTRIVPVCPEGRTVKPGTIEYNIKRAEIN